MNCQTGCYEVILAACEETIILTGLAASQSYFWLITTKNNKVYQKQTTSDNTGKLIIDTTILPPGSFSIYAVLTLELRLGTNYLTKIQFTFDGIAYECIQMRFQDIQGDTVGANVIGLNEYLPVPDAQYLEDVIEGANVTIDKTDPKNPIINATGGSGSSGIGLENAATFADISGSGKRFILVAADESNANDKSLYLFDGTTLNFLLTLPL
ncbi:MAG: hypothetical protein ABI237_06080 [Ginsengibacter sp.]